MQAANDPLDSTRGLDPGTAPPSAGDLALVAALLAVSLVPLLGELAHAGDFGAGTAGFATAAALVTGRELVSEARALVRGRLRRRCSLARPASGGGASVADVRPHPVRALPRPPSA